MPVSLMAMTQGTRMRLDELGVAGSKGWTYAACRCSDPSFSLNDKNQAAARTRCYCNMTQWRTIEY
jgi:hypothetical protein